MSWKTAFAAFRQSKLLAVGVTIVAITVLLAAIAPIIVVHDPSAPSLQLRLKPPQWFSNGWKGHILGTDALGRDILTRLLIGSRYSLVVALATVSISSVLGTFAGLVAGYRGGWVDNLLMRLTDVQLSIPQLLLAIVISAMLGPSLRNLVIVLVITSWPQYARVVRASVLVQRELDYVSSAKVIGGSGLWIMVSQILPNCLTPLFILATQQLGLAILTETSLSFLGLGVPIGTPSWGGMISDGRDYIATAPWVVLSPGVALMLTVMGFNFSGDGLRDVLDPRLRK